MCNWILDTRGKTTHKITEGDNGVRTGDSMQLETSALLGSFQWAWGGIHVCNVMPGDTDGESLLLSATRCALPLDCNQWRWSVCMRVCAREQKNMNVSLLPPPSRSSVYKDNLTPADVMSACRCSVRWVCDWTLEQCNVVRLLLCVRTRSGVSFITVA